MKTDLKQPCVRGFYYALGCGLFSAVVFSACNKAPEAGGQRVFKLREVSTFEEPADSFRRGQSGECSDTPFPQVKAYPAFKSAKPVYGLIRFGAKFNEPASGLAFHFAVDESQGTGKGYDRLYFDLNRDLDLRNEDAVKPLPPTQARRTKESHPGIKQQVAFSCLQIKFDSGAAGMRPVEILPRLTVSSHNGEVYNGMTFVRTRLYKGEIKVGGRRYVARLGNDYSISGRLDLPDTALVLSRRENDDGEFQWLGGDRLIAAHKVGSRWYTFAASPLGDELKVSPYDGEFGTFEVGAGGRSLAKLGVSGSLEAQNLAVAVGNLKKDGWPESVRSCQVPIGDYLPTYLSLDFGRLRLAISQTYHSDGRPRDRAGRAPVYGIKIRKDKPFVLDFSNRPNVLFALPAKDHRVKLGDTLEVKAVLVDSAFDLMIRRITDTTRKDSQSGDLSLDPTVTITRANGEKVAEGIMPFG